MLPAFAIIVAPLLCNSSRLSASYLLHSFSTMTSIESVRTKVLIVGAGFGGLGMGAALKRAGEDDFIILEKGSTVGGVWRDNTYPGCTCDVPSHLYSFSFAPYKSRNKRFPPQQEILAYLQHVASDEGLLPHLRLDTAVTEALYSEQEHEWTISTLSGQRLRAETVIFAVGQLHKPNYPNIPGLDDFCGPVFHHAEWNHDVQLRGRRIAVIGTGSSAAQMLPTLANVASEVTVYQRTPHWVLPKAGSNFGSVERSLLRIPGAHRIYRRALHYAADILLSPVARVGFWRKIVELYAEHHLHRQITDKDLIKKLKPSYPIGTKRILFDSCFYPTLVQPNVQLITEPIESVTSKGVETKNGTISTDIIVCATGFKASDFLVPISVKGRGGRSLNEDWKSGAEAYMGLAVHGYPNLFMIAGPNSFNPAGSNPEIKELQIAYIMDCLRWRKDIGADAIEVAQDATAECQSWLESKMRRTVWQGPVDSWYKHESGKVTNPWPESVRVFRRMLRKKPAYFFVALEPREV